jgi:VanZ family protein
MFFKYNWPGILCLAVIFILTGLPGNYFPAIQNFWDWLGPDKIVHLIMFGTFEYLVLYGFRKQSRFPGLQSGYIFYAMVIGIVFGAFTEVMQRFVFIGRSANVYDFLANTLGCFVGLGVYYVVNRKLKKIFRILNN